MDLSSGLLKLDRIITARRALRAKLLENPDNEKIKDTIKQHTHTIEYIKKDIRFYERFEINECTCPVIEIKDEIASDLDKLVDNQIKLGEDKIIGEKAKKELVVKKKPKAKKKAKKK